VVTIAAATSAASPVPTNLELPDLIKVLVLPHELVIAARRTIPQASLNQVPNPLAGSRLMLLVSAINSGKRLNLEVGETLLSATGRDKHLKDLVTITITIKDPQSKDLLPLKALILVTHSLLFRESSLI